MLGLSHPALYGLFLYDDGVSTPKCLTYHNKISVLWMLNKYFYLLWRIVALTLKNCAYFPRSFHKLCTVYSVLPLTFLWSLKLLVFMKKTVCVLCEEEAKFLNKIRIHCKFRIDCNKFYYILRIVLVFVQNVILKDKADHSKRFMLYCFFWNALGIEKERKKERQLRGKKNVENRQIAWATWIGKKKGFLLSNVVLNRLGRWHDEDWFNSVRKTR